MQGHFAGSLSSNGDQSAPGAASSASDVAKKARPAGYLSPRPYKLSGPLKLFRLEDFQLGKTVGTGTFGRVRIARYPGANKYFAMKIMRKADVLRLNQVEHIFSERSILSSISHPFIVKLYSTFQDTMHLYMLLEYVLGGELFTHLRKATRFSLATARFYASELVVAIEYMHSKGIVYRDLKPENLLLDSQGHLKIADFGFAKCIDDQRTWTLCGTPEYLAPEIIQSKGHGMAVDWWALGILIYEMLVGSPPFYDSTSFKIYEKILEGRLVFPSNMDAASRDLISSLLNPDPMLRLGNLQDRADGVKRHPWFQHTDWNAVQNRLLTAPFVPSYSHSGDTSNFDNYPDDDVEPGAASLPLSQHWQSVFSDF